MRHRGLILAGLCLAAFFISLDITIVNVALPTLVRQLGATTTGISAGFNGTRLHSTPGLSQPRRIRNISQKEVTAQVR